MISHRDWANQIRANVLALADVVGVATLSGDAAAGLRTPAAMVYPLSDKPASNTTLGALSQRVESRAAVLLMVKNINDRRGETALDELESLRNGVFSALLNWTPPNCTDPVEYAGGALVSAVAGILFWRDEFVTASYLRFPPR